MSEQVEQATCANETIKILKDLLKMRVDDIQMVLDTQSCLEDIKAITRVLEMVT